MNTQTMATKVTVLNNRLGSPVSPRISPNNSSLVLSEIHDQEILLLPEIKVSASMTSGSCATRRTSFQDPLKADYVIMIDDDARKRMNRSLIDIREESFDSETHSPTYPGQRDHTENHLPQLNITKASPSKLLQTRDRQSHVSLSGCSDVGSTRTEVQKLGTHLAPFGNEHHRPHLNKSHSQKEFSLEEKENLFPNIQRKSCSARDVTSIEREINPFPKLVPIGQPAAQSNGTRNNRSVSNGVVNNGTASAVGVETTASTNVIARNKGNRKVTMLSPKTRSSSVVSFFPCKLPSLLSRTKSSSQPDISRHSSSPSSTAAELLACHPVFVKKQRVCKLWRRAGVKLGLRQEDADGEEESIASWAKGPGDLLRPVYSRWSERRYALAHPERMCMPQEVRERVEKDVQDRRRSLKRRVSNFFTVKLGLNNEEDLAG